LARLYSEIKKKMINMKEKIKKKKKKNEVGPSEMFEEDHKS
jgi:hypothetical protein